MRETYENMSSLSSQTHHEDVFTLMLSHNKGLGQEVGTQGSCLALGSTWEKEIKAFISEFSVPSTPSKYPSPEDTHTVPPPNQAQLVAGAGCLSQASTSLALLFTSLSTLLPKPSRILIDNPDNRIFRMRWLQTHFSKQFFYAVPKLLKFKD